MSRQDPTPTCRYHCRRCGAHFTSLEAFDSHLEGVEGDRTCGIEMYDKSRKAPLVEIEGVCRISDPETEIAPVTLYMVPQGDALRKYHREREALAIDQKDDAE